MEPKQIGIIGAGPAGAWLAARLAQAGFKVLLFDHRAPWNKPCAGGLDPLLWKKFAPLEPLRKECLANARARLITINRDVIDVELNPPICTLPRKRLSQFLLKLAQSAGAIFSPSKITGFAAKAGGFELEYSAGQKVLVDFLVGADGAASAVRNRFCPAWQKQDYCVTLSLSVPVADLPFTLQFVPGMDGYAWIFPARGQSSIGVGTRASSCKAENLYGYLEVLIDQTPGLAGIKSRLREDGKKWLIPALRFSTLKKQKVVGENWALAGDASGAAHAASGEGVYYSFETAELLAQALIDREPLRYQKAWWQMCRQELAGPALWSSLFFNQRAQRVLAGRLRKSPTARMIASELVSCARPSRARLLGLLVKMFFDGSD